MDGVNNLAKKQVSCRDDSLPNSFGAENINDFAIWVIQSTTRIIKNYMEKGVIFLRMELKDLLGILGLTPLVKKDIVEGNEEVSVKQNLE
jgi:hypothetical protein